MQADGYFADYAGAASMEPARSVPDHRFLPGLRQGQIRDARPGPLNGKVMDLLKVVYTGSYWTATSISRPTTRTTAQLARFLLRLHGRGVPATPISGRPKPDHLLRAGRQLERHRENTHQSHEIRLSTNDDNRFRAPGRRLLGGVHHQGSDELQLPAAFRSAIATNLAISIAGGPDCLVGRRTASGLPTRTIPRLRVNSNTAFGEDVQARLQADRVFHFPRFRCDPEGADGHRRNPLLPLR